MKSKLLCIILLISFTFLFGCFPDANNIALSPSSEEAEVDEQYDEQDMQDIRDYLTKYYEENLLHSYVEYNLENKLISESYNASFEVVNAFTVAYVSEAQYKNYTVLEMKNTCEFPFVEAELCSSIFYEVDGEIIWEDTPEIFIPEIVFPDEKVYMLSDDLLFYEPDDYPKGVLPDVKVIPNPVFRYRDIEKVDFPLSNIKIENDENKITFSGLFTNNTQETWPLFSGGLTVGVVLFDKDDVPFCIVCERLMETISPNQGMPFSITTGELPDSINLKKMARYEAFAYPERYADEAYNETEVP